MIEESMPIKNLKCRKIKKYSYKESKTNLVSCFNH